MPCRANSQRCAPAPPLPRLARLSAASLGAVDAGHAPLAHPTIRRIRAAHPLFLRSSSVRSQANAGSNDTVLEMHEFLTMLVRISFYRANPQHGMRIGKDQKNADTFGAEVPLPGCLDELLCSHVLPLARRDTYSAEFNREVLPLADVQDALQAESQRLSDLYEMASQGRDFLALGQWTKVLESRLLLSDLNVQSYAVRLTEPQARWAFVSSAKEPTKGLAPEELAGCVARTACDKYRSVTSMTTASRVRAFLRNLLDGTDEEDAVMEAIEPRAPSPRVPSPRGSPVSPVLAMTAPTTEAVPTMTLTPPSPVETPIARPEAHRSVDRI